MGNGLRLTESEFGIQYTYKTHHRSSRGSCPCSPWCKKTRGFLELHGVNCGSYKLTTTGSGEKLQKQSESKPNRKKLLHPGRGTKRLIMAKIRNIRNNNPDKWMSFGFLPPTTLNNTRQRHDKWTNNKYVELEQDYCWLFWRLFTFR